MSSNPANHNEKVHDDQAYSSSDHEHDELREQPSDLTTDDDEKQPTQDPESLKKVASKASARDVASIPNGGFKAWIQVAGGWVLLFNSWGIVNAYGEYQTYYESGQLFQASSSNLSWIGSIQAFMLLLVGAITGPVFDQGHFRILVIIGTFLIVFGHMMLSLCNEYWEVLLAQGFCAGIGLGFLFVPAVAIVNTYFTTKLPIAIGLTVSGSSIGGIIYPIVFHRLEPSIGFAWATRVIGFMALGTLLVPIFTMQMRVKPAATRSLFDLKAFLEVPYTLFVLGGLLSFMGLLVPFFYISQFAITRGYTDMNLGFYLLAIINAASTFGRTLPNFAAAKIGAFNMLIPSCLISGILTLCLIAVDSEAGIIVISVLYGFWSGTLVSIPPQCFVMLSPDRAKIATRLGQGFTIISFGLLSGTPIAGAILGSDEYYTGVWIFSGVMILAGTALIAACRVALSGPKLMVKI